MQSEIYEDSQSSSQQRELHHAISEETPHVDLLLPSTSHRCSKCSILLGRLTRIVARQVYPQKEEGFSNYCIACFGRFSKSPHPIPSDQQMAQYQYLLIQAPKASQELTNLQNLALFQCVEKFSIDSWDNVLKEFTQRTGIKQLEVQLSRRYFSIYSGHDPYLNFGELTNPRTILDSKEGETKLHPDYFDPQIHPDDTLKRRFNQILKQNHVLTSSHYPSNNSYEYLLSIFAEKMTEPPNTPMKEHQKLLAAKWMQESEVFIEQESAVLDILRQLYVSVIKRQSRGGRRLISQGHPDYIGEDIEDYLELNHLNNIPNMRSLLSGVQDLKQKREALKTKQKKMKMALTVQDVPMKEEMKMKKDKKGKKDKKAKKPVKTGVKIQPNVRMTRSSRRF